MDEHIRQTVVRREFIVCAAEVNAEDLAPGTHPGRLALWTEGAVAEVADR